MSMSAAEVTAGGRRGGNKSANPRAPRSPKPAAPKTTKPRKPRAAAVAPAADKPVRSKTVQRYGKLLTLAAPGSHDAPGVVGHGTDTPGMTAPNPHLEVHRPGDELWRDDTWRAANRLSLRDEPVQVAAVEQAREDIQRLPVATWDKIRQLPVAAVRWLPATQLTANDYNPNHVAPPEMELLKVSILEDGWTQPIVARPDGYHYTIVDGFHRWTLAMTDPEVAALTDGYVPVVFLTSTPDSQRMSTIRHNRARGAHYVIRMAEIVADLKDRYGLSDAEIERRLGMEPEEIDRLYDRGTMVERGSKDTFSKGWVPQ